MKKFTKFSIIAVLVVVFCFAVFALCACNEEEQPSYTVTFESNGGTAYLPVTSNSGVVLPTPQKAGHVFGGWYLDKNFSESVSSPYNPTESVILYAKWIAIEGKITFVSNGGQNYEPIEFSAEAVSLPTPTRDGYTFLGWYKSADFSGEAVSQTYLEQGEVTLYAKWKTTVPSVVFDSNGGTKCESIPAEGEQVTLPTPSYYGYEFLGWFLSETDTTPVASPYLADKDVTLIAKWKKVTYVYLYYGTSTDHQVVVGEPGETLAVADFFTPDDLVIEHYLQDFNCPFVGWVYEERDSLDGYGDPVGETITLGDEHVVLLAKYDKSGVLPLSNVSKNDDGSLTTTSTKVAMVTKLSDTMLGRYSVDLSFAKGASGSSNIAFRMNMSGDDYAYEAGQYYLAAGIIPANGNMQISSVLSSWSHLTGKAYALNTLPQAWQDKFNNATEGELITVTLTVENYNDHFNFYIDGNLAFTYGLGEGEAQKLSQFTGTDFGIRCSTKGATFGEFKFEPIVEYTLKDGETTVHTGLHIVGETITQTVENKAITNDGSGNYSYQRFVGWSNTPDGDLVTAFGESATLYAKFESVTVYRVAFDGDNGDDVVEQFYHANETVTLPVNPEKNGETVGDTLVGYIFDKWVVEDTTTEVTNATVVTANLNVVATYTTTTAYVIGYVTNMEGVTVENSVIASGETFTLPTPTKQGYRLVGWYTDEDCTTAYVSAPVQGAFTLYAKWVETVVVTFACEGETIDEQTIDKGATAALPSDPTKDSVTHDNGNVSSFAFSGWFADDTQVTSATTFDTATTVTAKFAETVKRNGAIVSSDANGVVYTFTNISDDTNGAIADPNLSLSAGEYSCDINATAKSGQVRVAFLIEDNDLVVANGSANQGELFLNINLGSGGLFFGYKIDGVSKQVWGIARGSIATTSYAQKYTAGVPFSISVKVQYTSTWVKIYIDNELIYVFGPADYTGETLHGLECSTTNAWSDVTNVPSHYNLVANYLAGTAVGTNNVVAGDKVGCWAYRQTSGTITVSNLKVKPFESVTYINGEATTTEYAFANSAVAKALPNSQIADDGAGNYSYQRFVGWHDAQTGGNKVETISASCTLYARFETITVYKVTIDADNGSEIVSKYYHANEVVELPENPTKNGETVNGSLVGYTFDKWLCAGIEVTSATQVTANMTIVASYTESKAHTVTYVTNKNGVTIEADTLADGATLVLPENPTFEGYDFDGWYIDETLQTPYVADAVTSSFTLYAKWTEAPVVSFNTHGGTAVAEQYFYKTSSSLTVDVPTKVNYTFDGWYYDESLQNVADLSALEIDGDTTLHAKWKLISDASNLYNAETDTYTITASGQYLTLIGTHDVAPSQTAPIKYSTIVTGSAGTSRGGLALRIHKGNGNTTAQNENNSSGISIYVNFNNGSLQVWCYDKVNGHSIGQHIVGSGSAVGVISATNLVDGWNTAWTTAKNAAEASEKVLSVKLIAVDYGTRLEIYFTLDTESEGTASELAVTLYNKNVHEQNYSYVVGKTGVGGIAQYLDDMTNGMGYGLATSTPKIECSNYAMGKAVLATYINGDSTSVEPMIEGSAITKILPDGDVTDDGEGNFSYQKFVGWYDAQTGGNKVETITQNCTLYARFETTAVQTPPVEITFVSDGATVDTQSIASGTSAQLPENPAKADVTAENGNVSSFAFVGWFVGETQVTADTTFDANTTVTAKFTETVKRNGAIVSSDANGTTYSFTGINSNTAGAIADPNISLSAGELSCTVTASKVGTDCGQIRINVLVNDNGDVTADGSANEGLIFVNINLTSGGLILGSKVNNASKNAISATFSNINSCAYKTNYTAAKNNGTAYTFNVTMQFGANWLKVYVDGCLMFVIGTTTTETVYVKDTVTPNTTNLTQLEAYLAGTGAVTTGDKVGFWVYGQTVGTITVSNIKVTPASAPQVASVEPPLQQAILPTKED